MKKIIINGFFGKGNCGDEAILQTWVDKLGKDFSIIASVDADILHCNSNYKHYELYHHISLIQNRRVDIFCQDDIYAYIIGGGGLGLGFGVEQLLHAKLRNKKSFYLGTIVHEEFFDCGPLLFDINKKFFQSFEMISVRDKYSYDNLINKFEANNANFYPDVVFGMDLVDYNMVFEKDFVIVTVRDNGTNDIDAIQKWIDKINQYANNNNLNIIYIPFDKTDEKLMDSMGLFSYAKDIYWYPKIVKYIFSKSSMVFSLGRYHPLVFGISCGVTSYYINCQPQDSAWRYRKDGKDKSYHLLNDFNLIDYYFLNDNLNDEFKINPNIKDVSVIIKTQIDEFFEKLLLNLNI